MMRKKTITVYLKPYQKRMTFGFIIKFIGTIVELFLPLIMAYMVDYVAPQKEIWLLILLGLGMLALSFVAFFGNVMANRMASKVAKDATNQIRNDLFSKTLHLSAQQIDTFTIPSLVSRLSSDTYHVHQMIGMMQRLGVRAPILLLGGVLLTFTIDSSLALILLISVPFLTLIVFFVSKKGISLYAKLQKSNDKMVRKVRDDYTGIRVIKALSKIDVEQNSFEAIDEEIIKHEIKAGITVGLTNPLMNAILNLGMAAVIFVGAYRVANHHILPGDLIAFTSYFTIILNAVISISRIFVILSKGIASSKRIMEILNQPETLQIQKIDQIEPHPAFITFENVSFGYQDAMILKHLSFSIQKKESLGIIGATGAGKSTLISLLLRFYDAQEGQIFIDGKEIKSYSNEDLRKKIGIVFQNDFLIAKSIKENIDFERNLSFLEIQQAAKMADAHEFIINHGGYDSLLTTKGSNFSGGQKQRLLIARAIAAKPEILILDDSSSALDYKTDVAIRQTLLSNLTQTTIILIAQRISSVRFADHILVLDEGKVVGFGKDKELMENCPVYQQIYLSQHQQAKEGNEND